MDEGWDNRFGIEFQVCWIKLVTLQYVNVFALPIYPF
jgi:hypothetical protein